MYCANAGLIILFYAIINITQDTAKKSRQNSMSDEKETNKESTPFSPDNSDDTTDIRRTQVVKRPKTLSSAASDSPISFDPLVQMPKKDESSTQPTRDTAVLSRNNPMLKRALNQQSSSMPNGTTSLGETREVILLIRGMVERIIMMEDRIYKLGRFEMATKSTEEVDLTPYGAQDRGVSRIHAQLHLSDEKLFITDLGSTNGTYLSGTRLEPNEPTSLRKGDELLLGRLAVQVLFR